MNFTRDDKEVVKAFMEQREMKSFKCKTDGQSFWSGELRIAEHYPYGDGTATLCFMTLPNVAVALLIDTPSGSFIKSRTLFLDRMS